MKKKYNLPKNSANDEKSYNLPNSAKTKKKYNLPENSANDKKKILFVGKFGK